MEGERLRERLAKKEDKEMKRVEENNTQEGRERTRKANGRRHAEQNDKAK